MTLVEMHGGSVSIESKNGEDSTFTIRLPIAGPDQSEQVDTKVA
jgi:signal transduction histidine kinase